jgi:hypothetical protein
MQFAQLLLADQFRREKGSMVGVGKRMAPKLFVALTGSTG